MGAMLAVLNARWLSRGWRVMETSNAEYMAQEFIAVLDRAGAPWRHYTELYHRAVELRAKRLQNGLNCEDFSADLMAACWPSLKAELEREQIAAGRSLTANAASVCERCNGSGWESFVKDGYSTVRRCSHDA